MDQSGRNPGFSTKWPILNEQIDIIKKGNITLLGNNASGLAKSKNDKWPRSPLSYQDQ
uniref:Uncharacterized protein n=1 Tax=Moniliophthora roreri TaxID=221103 RepID=A0A0W0FP04_MONRR